jgi:hypothetical protein
MPALAGMTREPVIQRPTYAGRAGIITRRVIPAYATTQTSSRAYATTQTSSSCRTRRHKHRHPAAPADANIVIPAYAGIQGNVTTQWRSKVTTRWPHPRGKPMPAFAGMTRRTCHPAADLCRPCRNDETRYSGVRDGANIVILLHPPTQTSSSRRTPGSRKTVFSGMTRYWLD